MAGGQAFRGRKDTGPEAQYSCCVLGGARSMDQRRENLQVSHPSFGHLLGSRTLDLWKRSRVDHNSKGGGHPGSGSLIAQVCLNMAGSLVSLS